MDDGTAKEIAAHLAGAKRQLTHIKWLMVLVVICALTLAWFVANPSSLHVTTR
jgi:hypothetical protein